MNANRGKDVRPTATRGQDEQLRRRLLRAALHYAERGWRVLPLQVRGKKPLQGSRGFKDATAEADQIKQWWSEEPYNIGIRCDEVAGPIILDVDGKVGRRALKEFGITPSEFPLVDTNPKAGKVHLYCDPPVKLPKDGVPRTIGLREKFDVLGEGGYAIAPPSIHAGTGKPYAWRRSADGVDLPPLPVGVVKAIKARNAERSHSAAGRLPDTIPEGERDNALTSLAGSMRRRNASPEAVLAALLEENAARCVPPLAERQVRKIARSAESFAPAPLIAPPTGWNDITMAERFAEQERGTLRYCPTWKVWLAWDGRRWAKDAAMSVQKRLKDHILGMLSLAATESDDSIREDLLKALRGYTRQNRLKDVEILARSNLDITPDQLDADPWLLNVLNGTLDLRTTRIKSNGRLHVDVLPHDATRLLTKLAPVSYDPGADCPHWNGFLMVVLRHNTDVDWDDPLTTAEEDQELERYAQELAGLSLTGDVRDDALPLAHGPGASGKTTFMGTLQHLLGDYAVTIAFDLLLKRRFGGDDHRDLPRLHGARAAFASEVAEGQRWNLGMVKQLTGGDEQRGRWLYGEAFNFKPTAKIWCRANEKPAAYDPSNGFWRRVRLLPFEHHIPDGRQDKALRATLLSAAELTGILNWALEGLVHWRERGRLPAEHELPIRVRAATEAYRAEQVDDDPLAPFFETRCIIKPTKDSLWTASATLYEAMEQWWREQGRPFHRLPKPNSFGRALTHRGLTMKPRRDGRKQQVRGWRGIGLRDTTIVQS